MRQTDVLALLAVTTLPACWIGPEDDAGDDSFVTEATLNLQGRRLDPTERDGMLALVQNHGRSALVDTLMDAEAFSTHWQRVLADDLLVGRKGTTNRGKCFTEPLLDPVYDPHLVDHLATAGWGAPFCPSTTGVAPQGDRVVGELLDLAPLDEGALQAEYDKLGSGPARGYPSDLLPIDRSGMHYIGSSAPFVPEEGARTVAAPAPAGCLTFSMADVLRAAVAEDRMDVLYRAAIVPIAAMNRRSDFGSEIFMATYLGRDPGCMACHTTTYSTTDPVPRNGHWDRFYPIHRVDLEGTTFSWFTDGGATFNYGGNGGPDVAAGIEGFFGAAQLSTDPATAVRPWGISNLCTETNIGTSQSPVQAYGFLADPPMGSARLAGLSGEVGPLDLIEAFRDGVATLDVESVPQDLAFLTEVMEFPGDPVDPVEGATLLNDRCMVACHANNPNAPASIEQRTRNMPASRIRDIIDNGSPANLMPGIWLADPDDPDDPMTEEEKEYQHAHRRESIVAYLLQSNEHVNVGFYGEPEQGLAHLVAARIVDNVYEEMTGASLVLDHGFPRNQEASYLLSELTREFLANDWSLKILVKRIQLSVGANRNAPAESVEARYPLAMIYDPWAASDPSDPGQPGPEADANSQGDLVHRWSVRSLLNQAGVAMRWQLEQPLFYDSGPWLDSAVAEDLGAVIDVRSRGFTEPTLDVLLAWEDLIGQCEDPTGGVDMIDDVHATAEAGGATVGEALLEVKRRLISDGQWWAGEEALTEALSAEVALADLADASDIGQSDLLRDYCTAILRSPQFVLYGLPAYRGDPPPPSTFPPTSYDSHADSLESCQHFRDSAHDLGYAWYACDGETAPR